MKTLLKQGLLLAACLLLTQSCKRETLPENPNLSKKEGVTFHKLVINGNTTYVKEVNGEYFYGEDMGISQRQFNLLKKMANGSSTSERSTIISDFTKRWTNGVWYYTIQSSRTAEILQAMSWISAACNVQFVSRSNQVNYVNIADETSGSTSSSNHLGMESGTKTIKIHPSQGVGTIVHEIMHSLGFFHEQCRPDRDNYIDVFWQYIPNDPQTQYQYQISAGSQGIGAFDYNSIMLYPSGGVMQTKSGGTWGAQRDSISGGDRLGLGTLYGGKTNGPDRLCTTGIYTVTAGTLSIQNGSAFATLTSLGNRQYQLTKTGDGLVFLHCTVGSQVTSKMVAAGVPAPTITGPTSLTTVGTYNYTIEKGDPNSSIEYTVMAGDVTVNQIDNNHFSLQVYNPNTSGMNFTIRIRAREVSSCGTSGYTTKNVTLVTE